MSLISSGCNGSYTVADDLGHKHDWVIMCAGCNVPASRINPDHYVTFTNRGWFIEHSLECRLSGRMSQGCEYQEAIENLFLDDISPDDYGRWLITEISECLPSLERV